jgi:hypothetical protein
VYQLSLQGLSYDINKGEVRPIPKFNQRSQHARPMIRCAVANNGIGLWDPRRRATFVRNSVRELPSRRRRAQKTRAQRSDSSPNVLPAMQLRDAGLDHAVRALTSSAKGQRSALSSRNAGIELRESPAAESSSQIRSSYSRGGSICCIILHCMEN